MSQSYVKRRLWWKQNNRAIIDFGDARREELVSFHWVRCIITSSKDEEDVRFKLFHESEEIGNYSSEIQIKRWLIECAYDIKKGFLIPSEILFDADLAYLNVNMWVDDFNTVNTHSLNEEIVEGTEDVEIPKDRRIRMLSDTGRSRRMQASKKSKVAAFRQEVDRITAAYDRKYGTGPLGGSSPYPSEVIVRVKKAKSTNYPPRPADGSNLSPVAQDWMDDSWEGRCFRKAKDIQDFSDEACTFILAIEEEKA